jgi:hypothetical protein
VKACFLIGALFCLWGRVGLEILRNKPKTMSPEGVQDSRNENVESEDSLPENFEDALDNLTFQKKKVPMQYGSTIDEIRSMSSGGLADGVREEFYSGWTDGHFQKLLEQLGEK